MTERPVTVQQAGPTWQGPPPPEGAAPGLAGWLRALRRGVPLALLMVTGLVLTLLLRPAERLIWGLRRPVTPWITRAVCRGSLWLLGLPLRVEGQPMRQGGAIVANHSSWLDILVLNAPARVYFVSKEEVASWPGIGWLARATGTLFIRRDRREASAQVALLGARLRAGHRLVLFPEGTSTDGRRVLPFKPTLLAAFAAPGVETLWLQPASLAYHAPEGSDPRFYGWWGEMNFGAHLLQVLAQKRQGRVVLRYHPPQRAGDAPNRKVLARALEEAVRSGLPLAETDQVSAS
ncbi:lysophospholipid acyltransferase family protein [Pseudoroseicyclus aestuarii]|uniref:Lyso-ornithine lipid acyltransferase n=1 Tax=Pseudoroseicyclus aestuarii TaxID=1795041 RepID=A0A318T6J8_9RHOB|nr:lysophospholipid acyltransferase family protein [Pseudoroseicyclus aestuarii]PYE86074.1 lyso-ornithine lipid acyltransferase [Pseudoroseicyclus aestuarii]